jgi:lipopolysaccharide biosynthesis glycosyltransferase
MHFACADSVSPGVSFFGMHCPNGDCGGPRKSLRIRIDALFSSIMIISSMQRSPERRRKTVAAPCALFFPRLASFHCEVLTIWLAGDHWERPFCCQHGPVSAISPKQLTFQDRALIASNELPRVATDASHSLDAEIIVALGFDVAYVAHAAVVLASLVHNAPDAQFRFILLHTGTDALTRVWIENLSPLSRFDWIEVRDEDIPPFPNKEWISRATLFRLGLENLAPQDCERVLYLDSDLVIKGDVRPLWKTNLKGRSIAAATDVDVDDRAFGNKWILKPGQGYFNAGVLLIDLAKVREKRSFSKALDFVAKHYSDLPYSDQDALNWAFWEDWLPLEFKWNVQRLSVIRARSKGWKARGRLLREALIVHFTGSAKPWVPTSYHPWAWLYWQYLYRTPFARDVRRASALSSSELARIWLRWMRGWAERKGVEIEEGKRYIVMERRQADDSSPSSTQRH